MKYRWPMPCCVVVFAWLVLFLLVAVNPKIGAHGFLILDRLTRLGDQQSFLLLPHQVRQSRAFGTTLFLSSSDDDRQIPIKTEEELEDTSATEANASTPKPNSVQSAPSSSSSSSSSSLLSPPQRQLTTREVLQALGTSPRRIVLSTLSATGIALAGNLFGVTSRVLELVDETVVEETGLDTYYPRGEYKRVKTAEYTFLIPKQWVADTTVALLKAQQQTQALDYTMNAPAATAAATNRRVLPDAAFGPPGRFAADAGESNVSVIRTAVPQEFSLAAIMKSPTEGASFLLQNFVAPTTSSPTTTANSPPATVAAVVSKTVTLLEATCNDLGTVYTLEYQVERQRRASTTRRTFHAISVLAQGRTALFTMTVVAPQDYWDKRQSQLQRIASSFHLYN